jgi:type I restriction enzyme S subunit
MIADLKPYPEYKESGLPWLGQVPGHWGVKRAKSIFQRIDERSKTGKEELLTVSSARGIIPRKTANVTMFKAESYVGYKLCWPGDLVINSLWAWAGGLGVSNYHGIISSAYGVYRIRKDAPMVPSFVHEVVRSSPFNWELQVRSKGVWISRLQITDVSFLDAPIHIPPHAEQTAIVRFLDWATSRLERAIRAKGKVIALLSEQKQATVHRAVTRGLDPSVPLRSTGIPWLGDIPEHWEMQPLKFLCNRIQNGATPSTSERRYYQNGTVPWFGPSSINAFSEIGTPVRHLTRSAFDEGKARLIGGPAVLVVVIGATAGRMGLLRGEGATNQQITAFELKPDRVAPEFAIHQLRTSENWLRATASTATIPILDSGVVNRLCVAFPPVGEQECILSALSKETLPLATGISRLHREIALLREYRTRLLADVVTGKLDVREAAGRLPDEALPDTADGAELSDEVEPADEEVLA